MIQNRLLRRTLSIASVAVLWLVLGLILPVALLVVGVVDVFRRARFVRARLLLFLWVYLSYDLIGVVSALWLGLTRPSASPGYIEGHYRLQSWWCEKLLTIGSFLMGLRFEQRGQDCLREGPVLVFIRHTSFVDVLLGENFVARPNGLRLRYVLKRQLQADPALDLVLNRLPNCFVERAGDSEVERDRVKRVVEGLSSRDAALIYPEGTRFLPSTLKKIQEKFRVNRPELYPQCAELSRVLPPRLGGPFAMLDGAPEVDVVFVCHTGLDGFDTAKSMLSGDIVGRTVRLNYWRVPAAEIPKAFEARVDWIYEHWRRMDEMAKLPAEGGQ